MILEIRIQMNWNKYQRKFLYNLLLVETLHRSVVFYSFSLCFFSTIAPIIPQGSSKIHPLKVWKLTEAQRVALWAIKWFSSTHFFRVLTSETQISFIPCDLTHAHSMAERGFRIRVEVNKYGSYWSEEQEFRFVLFCFFI